MLKKIKTNNMYSILILTALLVFCCVFGSRNNYVEGLDKSTSNCLKDFVYDSKCAHASSAPAPMSRCKYPYFTEPKQCPNTDFLYWKFPSHVESGSTNHGVLGSLKETGGKCADICSADKNCSSWLIDPRGECVTYPPFNKGDTAKFSCTNNLGKDKGCVKAYVKSQGVSIVDVTPKTTT